MQETFEKLPDHLNATVMVDTKEFVVVILEMDELWSCVGNKKTAMVVACNAFKN